MLGGVSPRGQADLPGPGFVRLQTSRSWQSVIVRNILGALIALGNRAVVRYQLGIERTPGRRVRAVPGAMGFAEDGVGGDRSDTGVRHPQHGSVGCHLADVARSIHHSEY